MTADGDGIPVEERPGTTPIHGLGGSFRQASLDAGFTVALLLRTVAALPYLPRRMRFTLDAAYAAGVRALPVTIAVAFFSGMILALQTGLTLQTFGQTSLVGQVMALAMCREMGPMMTAIVLAATVGSKIAAELGTMKVSDEVTALDVMSIDPTNYLVLPRVAALTIMCPVLTALSDLMGIVGGSVVATAQLGLSQDLYWNTVLDALYAPETLFPKDVYAGLIKGLVFGATIATVACSTGLRARGGALGVGRAVQHAVMTSVILIIVFGYWFSWLFYDLLRGKEL
ncbi:MAG: ABC transporter permease [Planctomycetota bacterium]